MITYLLTLKGDPVTKKNSQQMVMNPKTQRWFPVPSKQYKKYEKACKEQLREVEHSDFPISYPVNVKCTYYMPTNRACDLTNLLEATCDILCSCGVVADDNYKIIASHDGSRVKVDKDNPRVEIEIRENNNA